MKFEFSEERARALKQRWSAVRESMLGPATERMLDAAAVGAGMRVLDIAAGAGDQTVRAVNRVGPNGKVVATDVSGEALEFAESEARASGMQNVEFRVMPCEALAEPDASFDAAICRNGLQYLSDQARGFAEIHRVLKPGGKVAAVVWSTPERNPFFGESFAIAHRRLKSHPPRPDEPGPFRLGFDGALRRALEGARFGDVSVVAVQAPNIFASAGEALEFQRQALGLLTQLLEGMSEADRADVWREIERALRAFERDGSFLAEGELLVGSGSR